jgi:glycosyltransferase involved in cell wall biosynthesis
VRAVRPQTRFIVVGDGAERAVFERGLAERGLQSVVEMAGWQSIDALPAFFHRSDVFLLTSRYETSARVLYLADEAGLRIVTTDVSGARELVGDRHAVAAIGDAAALARFVLAALTTPSPAAPAVPGSEPVYSEPHILRGFQRLLRESVQGAHVPEETHLCYVLPKYAADTAEHFLHTYELLSTLSESARLTVIVERSEGEPRFGSAVVYRQRFAEWLPLRIGEVAWLLLRARLQGARTFYIHYSNIAVLAAWLVTRACGGRVCYWHCVSRFFRHAGHGLAAWRHKVTAEWPLTLTMRLIDVLVTGTPSLAAMYRRTFGLADVRVVPNEINPARFRALHGAADGLRAELQLDEGPVVLFVHRLAPRKGALRLPALASALVAAVPRANLVIVGDGPSAPALRQAVSADAALAARVRFSGWVTNTQIGAYYAISDVLIMPSEEEGFPRVLLEAMAAGVPFVATDVGGVRDLCSDAQQWGIVPLDDEAAFADRVVTLLTDPARRARLSEDGLRHVQRYAIPVVARRTLSELNMLRSADQFTLAPREVSA